MKKILTILSVIVGVIALAIVAFIMLFDVNQFKPLIVKTVKAQTGFDIVMEGDIDLSVFPHVGLEIGKTELNNPTDGFKQAQILKIDSVSVSVSVMALLDKELKIGNVSLDGANIFVQKLKSGQTNLDLAKETMEANAAVDTEKAVDETTEVAAVEEAQDEANASDWKISLEGLSIANAKLELIDDMAGKKLALTDLNLALSEFNFDEWSQIEFNITGETNKQTFSAKGSSAFNLSQDLTRYQLKDTELTASYKDEAIALDELVLKLNQFQFGQKGKLTTTAKGQASGISFDMNQSATIAVGEAIEKINIDDFIVKGTASGDPLPISPIKLDLKSNLQYGAKDQTVSMNLDNLSVNELIFAGHVNATLASSIPKIRFEFTSPEINVDSLLAQMDKSGSNQVASNNTEAKTSAPKSTSQAATEPDLSATRNLDVQGKVTITKFQASNAKMQNVVTQVKINRGLIELQKFSADLYSGNISANAQVNAKSSVPTYNVNAAVKGVQVQPLIEDIAGKGHIAGTGNIDIALKGKSLIADKAKPNLAGTVKISFADGAVYGVNIAQEIRNVRAKFKGETAVQDKVEKTDFSALTATLNLANGVMTTKNVSLQSPLFRILGTGNVNYVAESMDLVVNASVVGSLKGQGGKDLTDLNGITVPVTIKGQWADPKIGVDLKSFISSQSGEKVDEVKEKAQKELDRGIDKLLGSSKDGEEDKNAEAKKAAGQLLNNLFK